MECIRYANGMPTNTSTNTKENYIVRFTDSAVGFASWVCRILDSLPAEGSKASSIEGMEKPRTERRTPEGNPDCDREQGWIRKRSKVYPPAGHVVERSPVGGLGGDVE